MPMINHVNYPNKEGMVYCRYRNALVNVNEDHSYCPYYSGSAQGEGIEERWFDTREEVQDPWLVTDPYLEKRQMLIADRTKPKEKLTVKADK